jgi:hypothetical protein
MWQTVGVGQRRSQISLCILAVVGWLLLTPMGVRSAQRYQWPTLAEVLRQNSVAVPTDVDSAVTINSFGIVNSASQFAIAYYEDSGTDALKPPLHVLRYDKAVQRWYHRDFREGELKAVFTAGWPGARPNKIDCFGSASVRAVADLLLVGTHLTPSAECTMILRSDLTVVSVFSGWEVAAIGSVILVERSEIHFAATHPLRLAIVDLATGIERDIFPPPDDPVRQQFSERLAKVADKAWCRENNASCDPQAISIELGKVATNVQAKAVAFEVTFDSEGFGPRADSEIGGEKYFYVFELAPLRYLEFDEFDMQPTFGAATPERLVQSENLRNIFATQ